MTHLLEVLPHEHTLELRIEGVPRLRYVVRKLHAAKSTPLYKLQINTRFEDSANESSHDHCGTHYFARGESKPRVILPYLTESQGHQRDSGKAKEHGK